MLVHISVFGIVLVIRICLFVCQLLFQTLLLIFGLMTNIIN